MLWQSNNRTNQELHLSTVVITGKTFAAPAAVSGQKNRRAADISEEPFGRDVYGIGYLDIPTFIRRGIALSVECT